MKSHNVAQGKGLKEPAPIVDRRSTFGITSKHVLFPQPEKRVATWDTLVIINVVEEVLTRESAKV